MSRKRGQRGHVCVEGRSWIGYWNIHSHDETTGEKNRKQRSARLDPKRRLNSKRRNSLLLRIEKSIGSQKTHVVDSSMSFEDWLNDLAKMYSRSLVSHFQVLSETNSGRSSRAGLSGEESSEEIESAQDKAYGQNGSHV